MTCGGRAGPSRTELATMSLAFQEQNTCQAPVHEMSVEGHLAVRSRLGGDDYPVSRVRQVHVGKELPFKHRGNIVAFQGCLDLCAEERIVEIAIRIGPARHEAGGTPKNTMLLWR